MKLDRNRSPDSPGKYALIKIRKLDEMLQVIPAPRIHSEKVIEIQHALRVLEEAGILDWCDTPETEAFVIRLKDKHAGGALYQYATSAFLDDLEYAHDIMDLAKRSGSNHPLCRRPD